MDTALDIDSLQAWIGKAETQTDQITPTPVAALSAVLDRNDPLPRQGDPLPPIWHWLYFWTICRQSELGLDGHLKRGGFLPPVPLPRLMFAGARMMFHNQLRIGDNVRELSRIVNVKVKSGRTGPLVFVLLRHEISNDAGLAIVEEQDMVYRGNSELEANPPEAKPAPADAMWSQEIHPNPVLLFRYSALIFVAHRIHYDRPYVTGVEGYPGLLVHGPLIATFLLELLRNNLPGASVKSFSFRAGKPLFDTAPFKVQGRLTDDGNVKLWAVSPEGALAVDAAATIA